MLVNIWFFIACMPNVTDWKVIEYFGILDAMMFLTIVILFFGSALSKQKKLRLLWQDFLMADVQLEKMGMKDLYSVRTSAMKLWISIISVGLLNFFFVVRGDFSTSAIAQSMFYYIYWALLEAVSSQMTTVLSFLERRQSFLNG
jgi:hypothetical protein